MTTRVHITDFKDFEGLQEVCNYFSSSIIEKGNNYYVFKNINPYEMTKYKKFKGYYNYALEFTTDHGFDIKKATYLLNSLTLTGEELLRELSYRLNYEENHIKRHF